ncbi:MAG: hypothetical protein H6732_12685 [Alphaproteobacteria bacterium]|nr:hypothetical protein [Alphaproteobacteria bacterium]
MPQAVSDLLLTAIRGLLRHTPPTEEELALTLTAVVGAWNDHVREASGLADLLPACLPLDLPASLRRGAREATRRAASDGRFVVRATWQPPAQDDGLGPSLRVESVNTRAGRAAVEAYLASPDRVVREVLSLNEPPPPELEGELMGHHKATVRRLLREAVAQPDGPWMPWTADRVEDAFAIVEGLGAQAGPLARLLDDDRLAPPRRALVERLLLEHAPELAADRLGPEAAFQAVGWRMLDGLMAHPEVAADIAALVAEQPQEARRALVEALEAQRREHGLSADLLWGPALARADLAALHPLLSGWVGAKDRSRAREPGVSQTLVSPCDGQGAYQIFLVTALPREDRWRVMGVVLRTTPTIRDGLAMPDISTAQLDDLFAQLDEQDLGVRVEVPPWQAAELVEMALAHDGGVAGLEPDVRVAVRAVLAFRDPLRSIEDLPTPALPPEVAAPGITDLLAVSSWGEHWFLDRADLLELGVPLRDHVDAAWRAEVLAALPGSTVLDRWEGMLGHMARVYAWLGDAASHATLAAARADLRARPLADQPFVTAMLDATADFLGRVGGHEDDSLPIGDESVRRALRAQLAVVRPRGRDLAILDVAELLVASEWTLAERIPRLHEARTDARQAALLGAAAAFVDGTRELLAGRSSREAVQRRVAEVVGARLPDVPADDLAEAVLGLGLRLLRDVCQTCPVACWKQLDRKAGRAYEAFTHPALE